MGLDQAAHADVLKWEEGQAKQGDWTQDLAQLAASGVAYSVALPISPSENHAVVNVAPFGFEPRNNEDTQVQLSACACTQLTSRHSAPSQPSPTACCCHHNWLVLAQSCKASQTGQTEKACQYTLLCRAQSQQSFRQLALPWCPTAAPTVLRRLRSPAHHTLAPPRTSAICACRSRAGLRRC